MKLLVERTGAGFAGGASAEELATALGALRPIAGETTSLILAQEVERALRELVGAGPAALEASYGWPAKRTVVSRQRPESTALASREAAARAQVDPGPKRPLNPENGSAEPFSQVGRSARPRSAICIAG